VTADSWCRQCQIETASRLANPYGTFVLLSTAGSPAGFLTALLILLQLCTALVAIVSLAGHVVAGVGWQQLASAGKLKPGYDGTAGAAIDMGMRQTTKNRC